MCSKGYIVTNNDYLKSLRYLLNVRDSGLLEILALANGNATQDEMGRYLKDEEDPSYLPCPHEVIASFLDGMVILKRGKDETRPPQPLQVPVTNNLVLKKVRVAFQLKDTDLIELIEKSGTLKISKTELSAFFRSPDHRNYRECGDQFLRNLLRALSQG